MKSSTPRVEEKQLFDEKLVTEYPKSQRQIPLEVRPYSLDHQENIKCDSIHLSPHGIEFRSPADYGCGTLLRINIELPNYWQRKRELVDYHRVEPPEFFRVLARVVKSADLNKETNSCTILAQTVNVDELDLQVLTDYLRE